MVFLLIGELGRGILLGWMSCQQRLCGDSLSARVIHFTDGQEGQMFLAWNAENCMLRTYSFFINRRCASACFMLLNVIPQPWVFVYCENLGNISAFCCAGGPVLSCVSLSVLVWWMAVAWSPQVIGSIVEYMCVMAFQKFNSRSRGEAIWKRSVSFFVKISGSWCITLCVF